MKKLLLFTSITLLITILYSQEWIQVPLCTAAQKAAGLKGGEGCQQIMDIAYAASNPKIVYFITDTCQAWKSIDGGFNWKMCHNGLNTMGGFSIVTDPNNENIVFVAGCLGHEIRHGNEVNALSGIYRSTNGAASWQMVKKMVFVGKSTGQKHLGKFMVFDKTSFNGKKTMIIFAGSYQEGFYKTMDGGNTWEEINGFKGKHIYDAKMHPKNKKIIYIAASDGLYEYNEDKKKISSIGSSLPDYPRTIAINNNSPEKIFVAVGNQGVYWSADGGKSFEKRNNGLPLSSDKDKKEFVYISISPVNPEYLYTSCGEDDTGVFYSHDSGNSWAVAETLDADGLSFAKTRWFPGQIEPHPLDSNIALTCANGAARVLKTEDGGKTWKYANEGYTGARTGYKGIVFFKNPKKMVFFLIDHGPYYTEDGGESFTWLPVPRRATHSTPAGAVELTDEGNVFVASVGAWGRGDMKQALIISRDKGQTWETKEETVDQYHFISFHPQKPNIIYAQGYKSTDSGKTFIPLSKKIAGVFPKNGDIVYSYEEIQKGEIEVFQSTDAGSTWVKSFGSLPASANGIRSRKIEVDPANSERLYIGTSDGLFLYNGKEWVKKGEESGLEKDFHGGLQVWEVAVDPGHPEIVYAGRGASGQGHGNGVFRSMDYGEKWQNISGSLGEITIWGLGVSPHDGTVYIGSSHGTWKLPTPYQK